MGTRNYQETFSLNNLGNPRQDTEPWVVQFRAQTRNPGSWFSVPNASAGQKRTSGRRGGRATLTWQDKQIEQRWKRFVALLLLLLLSGETKLSVEGGSPDNEATSTPRRNQVSMTRCRRPHWRHFFGPAAGRASDGRTACRPFEQTRMDYSVSCSTAGYGLAPAGRSDRLSGWL